MNDMTNATGHQTTFDRIVERLTKPGGPYGYDSDRAQSTAHDILARKSEGWVASFLGDIQGCWNCGEPATSGGRGAAWRCDRCETLPSDYL